MPEKTRRICKELRKRIKGKGLSKMKRNSITIFFILSFILYPLSFLHSQPYKLRVDSLRVDYKLYIGATDRFGFFSYLNGSNQLIGSTGLAAGSVYNDRLLAPYINFSAGDGLYGSGGQITLGNTILFQVNVDNSSLAITNDTLHVKTGGITSSHIVDGTIVNADISDPSISISAGEGLYGAPGSIDLGETMLLQVNVDDSTITITNDTLHVIAVPGGSVELNPNSILSDSSGLKVNLDPRYFFASGDLTESNWYSKNGGVTRSSFGFHQGIVNDTVYRPMPQTNATGSVDAWSASGTPTLYIENKAGDGISFSVTTTPTTYNISGIDFFQDDSIYIFTTGTIYIDNLYLTIPKQLSLVDSGITGDKIGTAEIEYVHLNDALHDSLSNWKVTLTDTNELKSYPGPARHVELLKLSSGNSRGGGGFTWSSAIPWGSAADGVTVFAASGGGYWGRDAYKETGWINAEWAGCIGDNSTDNAAAFDRWEAKSQLLSYQMFLPQGTYKSSGDALVLSATASRSGFRLIGAATDRSKIVLTQNAGNGVRVIKTVTTAAGYNFEIAHLSIIGTGENNSTGRGVSLDSTLLGVIHNLQINGHYIGLRVAQCNGLKVFSAYIEENKINVFLEKSSNEYIFENNYIVNSDSIEVRISGGQVGKFTGGAVAGGPIAFWVDNGAGVTISHVNVEQTDSLIIKVDGAAFVRMEKVKHVGTCADPFTFGRVDSGILLLEESEGCGGAANNNIILIPAISSSRTIYQKGVTNFFLRTEDTGLTYPISQWREAANNTWDLITADSIYAGQWRMRRPPDSATLSETQHLFYTAKVANGVYWNYVPGRYSDVRIRKGNTGEPSATLENWLTVNWEFPYTTNATDTVVLKITPDFTLPTSISSNYYRYQITIQASYQLIDPPTAYFWKIENNTLYFVAKDGGSDSQTYRASVDISFVVDNLDWYPQ